MSALNVMENRDKWIQTRLKKWFRGKKNYKKIIQCNEQIHNEQHTSWVVIGILPPHCLPPIQIENEKTKLKSLISQYASSTSLSFKCENVSFLCALDWIFFIKYDFNQHRQLIPIELIPGGSILLPEYLLCGF